MTAYAAADTQHLAGATERDNLMVWDRAAGGHYEVWYLTFNHLASKTGYWLRYTLESPQPGHGNPYGELWFAFFDSATPRNGFALHKRFPIDRFTAGSAPFEIGIGDAVLGHDRARGAIEGDGHRASWDLTWLPAATTHRHLPDVVYKTTFADTRVLSPNLDVPIRGKVVVDGRELVLEGDPGGQTHLWGRKHAHAWAWGHCNSFEGRRGTALEVLSPHLKRRGVILPLTVGALYLDGEPLRFTSFADTLLNRADFGTARYRFRLRGADARIAGEFACRPEDMVNTEYVDPDGETLSCANTCVADLRVTVWRRSRLWKRWQEQARLVAPRSGHFEVGGRAPDPAVPRRHVLVT
jgi:hypothetical protein